MARKKAVLIVLDSVGCGNAPDAAQYGDAGANTFKHIAESARPGLPHLEALGLGNIPDTGFAPAACPKGVYGRCIERAAGKDTTTGHWEMSGLTLKKPFPTYPNGFPADVIEAFEKLTGRGVLGNCTASGTEIIERLGEEHMKTGKLIVYTSADSVFQIAAHEDVVPPEELWHICEQTRAMLQGEHGVGRVIARPFLGRTADTFYRTTNRHDLSLKPPRKTMLDLLKDAGRDVIAVGKIFDIFDGEGVTEKIKTTGNTNGIAFTKALQTRDFEGLAFVNLVDFDMLYGHRRDVAGYAAAATEFDKFVADFIPGMREGDILMVTADHGCDPSYTKTTDHTREYVPYLICGKGVKPGVDLGTKLCFGTIAQTICDYLGVDASTLDGKSVLGDILA